MPLSHAHRGHVDGASGADSAVSGPIPVLANEILAITVNTDSFSGTIATIFAYTTSPNWGFSQRVDYDERIGGYCGIFALVTPPSGGPWSPVIHVEVSGASPGHRRPSFDIWTVTGADLSDPVMQVDRDAFIGDSGNLFFRSSPGRGNTRALISAVDVLHNGPPYVYGDGITPGNGFSQSGPYGPPGIAGFGTMAQWATADRQYITAVNLGLEYGLTPQCLATMMEFRPAPDPPVVSAGLDRTVEAGIGIDRTAGETERGTPVTTRQWELVSGPPGTTPGVLPPVGGDARKVRLPNTVVSATPHLIRYTAGSLAGPGIDDALITVILRRPSVNAGADTTQAMGAITRTATENDYGTAVTARAWKVAAGPSLVGTTIGTAAALSWPPPTLGQWTLSYTATSAAGTSDPDLATITVGVTGVPVHIGRTPEPLLAVAIAFGGNLADPDGSDWVFTEVTTDVRIEQGIHVRHGKGDEASVSQPAQVSLTLDNRLGKYSLGGRSPYWPNVRQGTPVQISCNLTGNPADWKIIFTGYADGFTPIYSERPTRLGLVPGTGPTGDTRVSLVASGNLRRMSQGQPPVISPMRRGLVNASGVVAYWPCEDGEGARFLASAFPAHPAMDFSGRWHDGSNPGLPAQTPRLAGSDVFACSGPLPLVNDSEWYGVVPDYTATNVIQLRFLVDIPAAGSNDSFVLIGLITTGDPSFWELRYKLGTNKTGVINVRAWRNFQTLVKDEDWNFNINGKRGQMGLTLTQNGTGVDWTVDLLEVGASSAGIAPNPPPGNVASATVGKAVRVQTATDGGHVDVTLGHIVVRNVARNAAENIRHLNAWSGENVGERLLRLTQENVLWYWQSPDTVHNVAVSDYMGPQPVGTVLDLFRDCERTDGGILWDGVGAGLSYTTKRYRESRAPALVLDAALEHVGLPFTPVHDDAYRCNRAVARRHGGASGLFEDKDGPLGSGIVGRYEDAQDYGCRDDSALAQYAGWMVGQGTVEGYRYPRLSLNLARNPQFLDEWLAIIPGDRVDVLNLSTIHPAAPVETLRLAVEGFEQTITPHSWLVTMNTSLYRRWAVAQVAAEATGDPGDPSADFVARVETNGTIIATLTAAGQTTLTVDVTAGPLWTTRADDYPLTLDVGAVAVRATACTAPSGAQQTFTIDPMPVTRPAGVRVTLWNAPVFGL